MKNKVLPVVLLLIFSVPLIAQKKDSVRNIFVERFPDYFFVWPVLKQRTTSFEIEQKSNRSNNLTYKPNNAYGLGFGLYLFEIGAEITFAIPVEQKKKDIFGESHALDLQLNLLSKNWGADLFYQRYTGFYVTDPNKPVKTNTPYPQRPDMSTDNFGINGIYIFNKHKFSLRSAYNFAERQRKSAGSFLLAGTMNSFQMKADSALFGKNYEGEFGTEAAISEFNSFTVSISPGYTYTLVVKNLFINASVSVGPAYRDLVYIVKEVRYSSSGVDGFTDFRIAMGYNGERFFSGLSYVAQTRNVIIDEVRFTALSGTVKFVMGYRFREFGILKARAVDIIPFVNKKSDGDK